MEHLFLITMYLNDHIFVCVYSYIYLRYSLLELNIYGIAT